MECYVNSYGSASQPSSSILFSAGVSNSSKLLKHRQRLTVEHSGAFSSRRAWCFCLELKFGDKKHLRGERILDIIFEMDRNTDVRIYNSLQPTYWYLCQCCVCSLFRCPQKIYFCHILTNLFKHINYFIPFLFAIHMNQILHLQHHTWTYIHYLCLETVLLSPHIISLFLLSGKPVSWLDGSALDYSNWKSQAGVAGKRTEPACAVMMAGVEGTWTVVNCNLSHSRVVCKTEASEYRNCIKGIDWHFDKFKRFPFLAPFPGLCLFQEWGMEL